MGCLHGEIAAAAQRCASHGIACGFIHRQAFAGDGGFIDGGLSLGHNAVHGDCLARTDDEQIPLPHLIQRDFNLLALPQQMGGSGRQRHQLLQGIGGMAFAAGLPVLAHADKGEYGTGGFKVEVHVVLLHQRHIAGGKPLCDADNGVNAVENGCG